MPIASPSFPQSPRDRFDARAAERDALRKSSARAPSGRPGVASFGQTLAMLLAACTTALSAPAEARPREHGPLHRAVESGALIPLAAIEQKLLPKMRGSQYLGPEFDEEAAIYRLKFIRNGQVIWIDVDARSGRVVNRTGP